LGLSLGAIHLLSGEGGSSWLLLWSAMGPIFVESFSRWKTLERAMGMALLMTVGFQVLLLILRGLEANMAPWTLLSKGMERALMQTLQVYEAMGMDEQSLQRLRSATPEMARTLTALIPGLAVVMNLMIHWWTLLLQRRFFPRWGWPMWGPPALSDWRMPDVWVWATIAGGILLLMPGRLAPFVGANLLMLMGALHFLQGLGVVHRFFDRKGLPPFLRGIFYALIFFQQVLLLGVAMVGLFDIWIDFRSRWRRAH